MSESDPVNPYNNRDHETGQDLNKSDIRAVAALLGQVTGSLKEIDNKVVGSSEFTRALKIDPKQTLQNYASSTPESNNTQQKIPPSPTEQVVTIKQEENVPIAKTTVIEHQSIDNIQARVDKLEDIVLGSKKFKRGITYNVSSLNVKGNFKNKSDILSMISSELDKNVKVITIRLNDTNKDTKQK